jgi:hypothetical protein
MIGSWSGLVARLKVESLFNFCWIVKHIEMFW